MLPEPIDLCAYAYLEYYRSQFRTYSWAYDRAEYLVNSKPVEGIELIVNILKVCRNEEEVAYVASGLLEELLHKHIDEVVGQVIAFSDALPVLRRAMKYVWVPEGGHLQNTLLKATGKTGANFLKFDATDYPESKAVDE